jgi:hypothetical protein
MASAAGPKVGQWAAAAQGGRDDGGGGVGRRAKVGRRGYDCGSVALADAPGTASNTNERSSSDGDGGAPVTATMVLW